MKFKDPKTGKTYEISYSQSLQKQQLDLDRYRAKLERQKQSLDLVKVAIMVVIVILGVYVLYRLDKVSIIDYLSLFFVISRKKTF